MRKFFGSLLILAALGSCAFNKLFLAPYPLKDSDRFTQYVERYNDSLTLSFHADRSPHIVASSGLDQELSYTVKAHSFSSPSESSIHAWLFTPKGPYNGVTLYFLHGNAGNVVYQYALASPFVEKGYKVFMIDYSGFGFSTGKTTRKNVLMDANAGLDYLLSQLRSDEEVVIYGQSLGGHLAVVVAESNPGKFKALVLEGAFSSHKDIAADKVPVLARIFVREMYSAEKCISKVKAPVLIIHSTEDLVIPYKQGLRLFEKAVAPKQLYTIEHPHVRGPLFYLDSICARIDGMLAH